jgi:sugar phosphate isomerase/epimerase
MTWQLSLFTTCAPWLPLDELAPMCAAAGLAGLDLAIRDHAFDRAKPLNFWNNNAAIIDQRRLEELVPPAAAALRRHGLAVRMLNSYIQPSELDVANRLAAVAAQVGAPLVRVWSPAPRLGQTRAQVAEAQANWRELERIAAQHGIRFVLELHNNTITTGASGALRLIDGLDPKRVGVILDIANTAIEGNEPLPMAIDLLGPYVAHVHVKDLAIRPGNQWHGCTTEVTPLGLGHMRWTECLCILRNAGYQGWLAIENFTGLERGPARIAEDAAWLRARIEESRHAA